MSSRCIGLDVHRDFAQVAIWQDGVVHQEGRFAMTPEEGRAFAARFLVALAGLARLAVTPTGCAVVDGESGYAMLDVDDTIVEVHGHGKQGAGIGYSRVRGLNALLATLSTDASAPVILAQRLRKGVCNSSRGAKQLVGDAVKQARRLLGPSAGVLVRMDSAFTDAVLSTPRWQEAPRCTSRSG